MKICIFRDRRINFLVKLQCSVFHLAHNLLLDGSQLNLSSPKKLSNESRSIFSQMTLLIQLRSLEADLTVYNIQ